jgi:hypothetical protein
LTHASGEFVWAFVGEVVEADEGEELAGSVAPFGFRDAAEFECELDVLDGGAPREQRGFLEHERDPTVGTHGARRGRVEPGDEVEQGRFAASGRADDADELAAVHGEGDVVEGDDAVVTAAEALDDVDDLDRRPGGSHLLPPVGGVLGRLGEPAVGPEHQNPSTGLSPRAARSSLSSVRS